MMDFLYQIFLSFVLVFWCGSGMGIFFWLVGEPSHHAEGPAIILFYIMPAFMCAMLGPFTGVFWIIKKLAQRYG
jgi:hypothetical protein